MRAGSYPNVDRHNPYALHPNLENQSFANAGAVPDGFFNEGAVGDIDSTPLTVAVLVLGAAVLLVGLKAAGFRFNFGVGANVGR